MGCDSVCCDDGRLCDDVLDRSCVGNVVEGKAMNRKNLVSYLLQGFCRADVEGRCRCFGAFRKITKSIIDQFILMKSLNTT
jgi:hypothetical protein